MKGLELRERRAGTQQDRGLKHYFGIFSGTSPLLDFNVFHLTGLLLSLSCCFLPFHILGFDVFGGSKMNCYCRMIGLVIDSNGFSVQFYVLWIATTSPRITSD